MPWWGAADSAAGESTQNCESRLTTLTDNTNWLLQRGLVCADNMQNGNPGAQDAGWLLLGVPFVRQMRSPQNPSARPPAALSAAKQAAFVGSPLRSAHC